MRHNGGQEHILTVALICFRILLCHAIIAMIGHKHLLPRRCGAVKQRSSCCVCTSLAGPQELSQLLLSELVVRQWATLLLSLGKCGKINLWASIASIQSTSCLLTRMSMPVSLRLVAVVVGWIAHRMSEGSGTVLMRLLGWLQLMLPWLLLPLLLLQLLLPGLLLLFLPQVLLPRFCCSIFALSSCPHIARLTDASTIIAAPACLLLMHVLLLCCLWHHSHVKMHSGALHD